MPTAPPPLPPAILISTLPPATANVLPAPMKLSDVIMPLCTAVPPEKIPTPFTPSLAVITPTVTLVSSLIPDPTTVSYTHLRAHET